MVDPFLAQSDLDRTLEALPSPGSVTQTPGLSGLAPSLADLSVMQQRMLGEISALGRGGTAQQPAIQQNIAYSPSTKKYWVNDTLVDTGDIASMLQGAARTSAPGRPAPGNVARDWVPVTQQAFTRTVEQLKQPRGFLEKIGLGFTDAAGGLVGGVGRGLEIMGAPSVGKPIAEFAERTFEQSEYEKQRDALIQQSNSLFSNIMDATVRGLPSVASTAILSIGGGIGGAALAARVGASAARGAAIGSGVGAAAAVFPSEVQGLYEAAQKGGYNVEDPGVQNEILTAALGSSILQMYVPTVAGAALASQALKNKSREIAKTIIDNQAKSRLSGVAGAAAGAGFMEALAEGSAALIQQATFDPEFRKLLSAEDRKLLVPFMVQKYGENTAIAAGAGAILGAGFGGAGKFLSNSPVDMTKVAGEKAAAEAAAQAAPAETTALPPSPPPATTDEILASAWEQSARMAMQPAQLGLAPYGENPALGAAWERAVAKPAGPAGLSITSEAAAPPPVDLAALLSGEGAPPAPTAAFVSPTYVSPTGAVGTQAAPYVAPPPVRGVQETFVPSAQPAPTPTAAAAPARVEFVPPVAEAPYGNVPAFQPIPQVSFPGSTKAERDAAFAAAQGNVPPTGPMARQLTPLADRLRARGEMAKVEPRLAATEQQAAAAREAGAYAQRTDAEIDADTLADTLVPNFMILTDKAQDRWRAAVADIDADTRAELIDGDPTTLAGRQAMDQLTRIANDIRRSISPKKRAAAAEPATQTQGEPNAAPEGQKSEGGLRKRTDADKGGSPPKAGRGDSLKQGGQKQAAKPAPEVTPAPAPTPASATDRELALLEKQLPALKAALKKATAKTARNELKADIAQTEARIRELKGEAPAPETPTRPPAGAAETPSTTAAPAPQPEPEAKPSSAPVEPAATASTETKTESEQSADAARKKELLADLAKIRQAFINARTAAELDRLRAERDVLESELSRVEDRLAPKSVGNAKIGAALIVDAANETKAKYEAARPLEIKHKQLRQTVNELVKRGTLSKADAEKLKQTRAELKKVEAELAATPSVPVAYFSLVGFNTVTGAIDYEGKPIARPMAEGRVRMAVRDLLSKLTVKPNVRIFKDQADLKARDPALYREAVAARPQGDFDKANAAGYSFGDNRVIIFSDRIANDRHLRFVLAHETIGHMGLRALMPANKFDPFMESLYDVNPRIQYAVDYAMKNRKLSKAEAVEEYLADYAGLLESSMVLRVWNAIKGGLNKLGVKFGDEAARYWLDQAKRYVRTGEAAMFDAAAIAERLQAVETGQTGPGRFSVGGIRNSQQIIIDEVLKPTLSRMRNGDIVKGIAAVRRMGAEAAERWNKTKREFLSLSVWSARESAGLTIGQTIMTEGRGRTNEVISRYGDRMEKLKSSPTLDDASRAVYDMRVYSDAKTMAAPDADTTALFTVGKDGTSQVNKAEVDRLFNKYLPTLKELQDGVPELTFTLNEGGREVTRTWSIPPNPKLTKEVYDEAVALRRMMADIELETLKARIDARLESDEIAYKAAARIMRNKEFTADERRFVVDTARKYKAMKNDPAAEDGAAETFLAKANEAIIAKGFDETKFDALRASFDDAKQADAYIERLKNFRKNVVVTDETKFVVQNKIKEIIAADAAATPHVISAKRNILAGLVPVDREGSVQVRVGAFVDGKPVTLAPEVQEGLVLSLFASEADAQLARETLNKSFEGKTIEALVLDRESVGGAVYKPQKVTLVAQVDDVVTGPSADPRENLEDFLAIARRLNINLTPSEMERLTTTLTNTANAARRKLMFSNTPGYDRTTAPQAISRHIERRASTIGKQFMLPKMNDLLDRDGDKYRYWTGDAEGVMALKERLDNTTNPNEIVILRRQLDRALYQYKSTNIGTDDWDGSRSTQPTPAQIKRYRTNRHYNEMVRTLATVVENQSLLASDADRGQLASDVRSFAAFAYFALSASNGIMNFVAVPTNWAPYVATYNGNNGVGGGFGIGRANAEFFKAIKQVGGIGTKSPNFRAAEYFERVANDPALLKKHGLTKVEAEFIAEQTARGVMAPAESNTLRNTARGQNLPPIMRKFIDAAMYPFNTSEQIARRAAGLAAFRLEYDRQIAAGVSAKDAAANASDFAVESINLTLGDYNFLNRPFAWRQGIPSLLYTFKTYPTNVIQLMRNLTPAGAAMMLVMLWTVAGVAGLPLFEDAEDIIDTIAQKLKLPWAGIRVEFAKKMDELFPGVSPIFLKGFLTEFMGLSIDLGAKFSMGDLIPGTGALLAGAKVQDEIFNLAGPIGAAATGALVTAGDILSFPFSSTKTLEDVARNSPVTFLRTMGDASAYLNTGAIVDRRGYVVSNELTTGTIIGRLMGFYPKEAADQYEVIKFINRTANYQKEMAAGLRQAWIKAKLRGNEEAASAVQASAADWNDATRGTALEMRNWLLNSQRALIEAKREAIPRTLKTTPLAGRKDLTDYADLLVD